MRELSKTETGWLYIILSSVVLVWIPVSRFGSDWLVVSRIFYFVPLAFFFGGISLIMKKRIEAKEQARLLFMFFASFLIYAIIMSLLGLQF